MAATVELVLPTRLPWQETVIAEAERFNVPCVGRQAGKTTMCQDLAVDPALDGWPVGWWVPVFKTMLEVWAEMRELLHPVTQRVSVQERRIELWGGGLIEFWSLDHPDSARGRRYKRAVVDEAAMVANLRSVFAKVIRPTLAAFKGDAWFPSTPKGLNDYYTMWGWGQPGGRKNWKSWRLPSSVNPYLDPAEIAAAKADSLDDEFRQEWLAEFLEAGALFRFLDELAIAVGYEAAQEGRRYVMGVDLASTTDFTDLSVLDVTEPLWTQVYRDRWTGLGWDVQLDRIRAAIERFGPDMVEVDRTGLGDMPFQSLAESLPGVNVWGIQFNAGNKMDMVQSLALAFEKRRLHILPDPVQVAELRAYEAKRKPSGAFTYSAPSGQHDDSVTSLMLAVDAADSPGFGVLEY